MGEFNISRSGDILPGGKVAVVLHDNLPVIVCRLMEGTLVAFLDRCSHARVKLSAGSFCRGIITCPAHGAQFDAASGRVLCPPATQGLTILKAGEKEGEVFVTVPDEVIGPYVTR